jgi:hypothetical protein
MFKSSGSVDLENLGTINEAKEVWELELLNFKSMVKGVILANNKLLIN